MEKNKITIPVQINGYKKGSLIVEKDSDTEFVEEAALSLDCVLKTIENKVVKKVVVIPNRIVNIII